MKRVLRIVPLMLLAGCHMGGQDDLHQFVRDAGAHMRGRVEPLPEVKPYQPFVYNDFDQSDPFKPRKLKFNSAEGGIQPDLNRPKELLESFALETLKMVGVIQRNGVNYAVIKTPLNTIYVVKVGNYLGQNFGKIVAITDKEVKLKEIVQDGAGDWSERDSSLNLQEQ
ncbi:MAG: pilus assembly protein PilP [Betaproteobacteria bacterium]|nr:pilus assembly protein PilP [Betaproteobacteria bacterium]